MSNTPQIRINLANSNDFYEVIQLYKQLWEEWQFYDEDKLKAIFQTDLETSRKIYLVARKANKIVGVCSLVIKADLHYLKTAIIDELIVDINFRKQGIGKKLLNMAFEIAKKRKCYRVELNSNMARTDAHKFYEANGFEKSSYYFKKKL